MPPPHPDVTRLLRKLLEGDEDAATELVARYSHPLRMVIRRHLDARVRPALDSADVEQQVWGSFFCRELYREALEDPEKLRQFLLGIARRKALMASRDHLRDKRDRRREVPLEQTSPEGDHLQARQPGPQEAAEKEDLFRQASAGLPDRWRAALRLLREGHAPAEAAARVGVCARTLARLVERLRQRAQQGA
jgi:RNA polymerase sigma factor (sigma-70 family)